MKVAMAVPYLSGFQEAARRVAELEKVGLDIVTVPEFYGFDAPSYMGYLAAMTSTVEIMAGIMPIYSRTPALIAQTAAGVDALSDGRCILGLGASGPQVVEGWHGVAYDAPLGRTREIVEICRMIWRREPLVFEGKHYRLPLPAGEGLGLGKSLKLVSHPVRQSIPIYLAAIGPANVRLTAEIAEGWLPIFFAPECAAKVWGDDLAAGRARRSPDLPPLEMFGGGLVAIGEDQRRTADLARPQLALYIGGMGARGANFYHDLAARYGFEAEADRIQDLYLDGKKEEAAAAVPEALLDMTNLCGPAGYVKERIAALKEAGVTVLSVNPVGDDPVSIIEQVKAWVQ
jgi:F420-dependent oxidoreductase-like protein